MEKIMEIRLGGGRVHSGMVPMAALAMLRDLASALRDHGGSRESWANANPHLAVAGAGSTKLEIQVDRRAAELLPAASSFLVAAEARNLHGRSRDFALKHFRAPKHWGYAELRNGKAPPVKLSPDYCKDLLGSAATVTGSDELYLEIIRVGGMPPRITAAARVAGRSKPLTCMVANQELARELGQRLYETVKVKALVTWDTATYEITEARIDSVDEQWQDVHLADVITAAGGLLPVELSVDSVEDLIIARSH